MTSSTQTLHEAARQRDVAAMKAAWPHEASPKLLRAIGALEESARMGFLEGVLFLVPFVEGVGYRGQAIRHAAGHGHLDCLRAMLPPEPTTPFSEAQTVLLSEPVRTLAVAMVEAAGNGHEGCVRALLPHAGHGKRHRAQAIERAAVNGHRACMDILWTPEEAALAFQTCLRQQQWTGVDALMDAVDPGVWRVAHQKAQAAAARLPRIEARLLRMALAEALPSPPEATSRPRV